MNFKLIISSLVLTISCIAIASESGQKNRTAKPTGTPSSTLLNINKMSAWYSADGEMERRPMDGNSGLTYPRQTSTAVYASGLMIGTIATDGIQSGPRITGFSYSKGFQPGAILGIRTGVIENPTDPNVRIWRIRRDYATADLKLEAAEFFTKDLSLVDELDVQSIQAQYKKDWVEWPASKGAPFYDANNDGIYSPQFETVDGKEVPKLFPLADEPGIAKADQVIWYVSNDIGPIESPWKTKAVGLEQQATIWGYNSSSVPGNIIYKKFKLIYKGTAQTPVGSLLTNTYLSHWSDPDLGDAGDDFVGCDTILSVGFVYNSKTLDGEYRKFNLAPPSLGYDFLQGPIVASNGDTAVFDLKKRAGFKNLPMTSFIYFGAAYTDPPFTFNGSTQWYQMMRGLPPTPQGPPDPAPLKDPTTGFDTRFWLPGDPVTNTGWIDKTPGDRRMLQSSGPFTMALGDTQEIVVGVVGGIGGDYLQSISVMKENDRTVQFMYSSLFESVPPSVSGTVSYPNASQASILIKANSTPGKFLSIYGKIYDASVQLFDDGSHNDDGANDGIFANSIIIPRSAVPSGIDVTFTDNNNKTYSIPKLVERITTSGAITATNAQVIFDNINNNGVVNNGEFVHYTFTIKNNSPFALAGLKAIVSSSTEFAKEYLFGSVSAGGELTVPVKDFFSFRLPMNFSEPNYKINIALSDNKGNFWNTEWTFPVVQQTNISDSLTVSALNVVGSNDAQVGFILYDKSRASEQYDIWFGGSGLTTRNWTVVKNLTGSDYATVTANLTPVDTASVIKNSNGSFEFTINDAKTTVAYKNFSIGSLSGPITSADMYMSKYGINGPVAYSFSVVGNTIANNTWQIPDSLVTDFIAGNLFVNIKTALRPNGEIRGQIADGLLLRQNILKQIFDPEFPSKQKETFSYNENRLVGFSLYIGPPIIGTKSLKQTSPSIGNVWNQSNPENTYRIIDSSLWGYFAPLKSNDVDVEIRFNNEVNWAIALLPVSSPVPSQAYTIKVPFAFYKDTVRVWPVVIDRNNDSVWNVSLNGQYNGKPTFDKILGVADVKDGSNNDIRYYSSANIVFPPTSNTMKGRLMNESNHILSQIIFVNESGNGLLPSNGTKILFTQNKSINIGDIKSFTLKTLGVEVDQISSAPQDYSLSQNYPNPFNPTTKIEFTLPHQSIVSLKIYDVIGREVATLLNEEKSAGRFSIQWDGKNNINRQVASGVYFYKFEANQKEGGQDGSFVQSKKMILLK